MENKNNTTTEPKIKMMTGLLRAEQVAQLVTCTIALYYQPIQMAWWLWPVIFLLPDVSMMGYLINTRVGALCYNLAHHKAIAGLFIGVGFFLHLPVWLFLGLLLWAHSSFDRALGYGLKYPNSFQNTHLGLIGKNK